jgi:hypothetical protein
MYRHKKYGCRIFGITTNSPPPPQNVTKHSWVCNQYDDDVQGSADDTCDTAGLERKFPRQKRDAALQFSKNKHNCLMRSKSKKQRKI